MTLLLLPSSADRIVAMTLDKPPTVTVAESCYALVPESSFAAPRPL